MSTQSWALLAVAAVLLFWVVALPSFLLAGALLDLYSTGGAKLADLKAAAINIDAVQRATSVQAAVAAAWSVVRNRG